LFLIERGFLAMVDALLPMLSDSEEGLSSRMLQCLAGDTVVGWLDIFEMPLRSGVKEPALELYERRDTSPEGAASSVTAGGGGGVHWSLKVPYNELDGLKV